MLDALSLPYVQRGLLEVALLSVAAGLLGTWIVLRGLAFYAHAVGTAAFPGLVLAGGLGFAPALGAFGTAAVVAAWVGWLSGRRAGSADSVTALVLVAALAAGVILASDVFASPAGVEQLLFGSLLLVDGADLALAGATSLAALATSTVVGARWLAVGFDAGAARAQGLRAAWSDALLLALVALGAVAALSVVGALLATTLLVVPAATTRLLCHRLGPWQLATVALAAVEGAVGLWLSVELNAPPGPAIAVLAAGVFALTATGRALARPARSAALALVVLALGGCGANGDGGAAGAGGGAPVRVVATTTHVADLARQVGGDAAHVTQTLAPNTDPHDYEPRPDDIAATAEAEVVLTSGDGLDRWMADVVEASGATTKPVDVGAGRPQTLPGEEGSRFDPHWWHDPRNVEHAIGRIADSLIAARPAARDRIARRADGYRARVRALDDGVERCLERVPARRRRLVTDHDAFGYLARRYGIEVIGAVIPSQTTLAQPSAGDLAELARVVRRAGVRAIFPEIALNARLTRALARETGAVVGAPLYADTLGPEGSGAETYLASAAANADALVRGFTGGREGCPVATS